MDESLLDALKDLRKVIPLDKLTTYDELLAMRGIDLARQQESEGVVVETHACYIFNLGDVSKHFKPNDRVRVVVTRMHDCDDPAYADALSIEAAEIREELSERDED